MAFHAKNSQHKHASLECLPVFTTSCCVGGSHPWRASLLELHSSYSANQHNTSGIGCGLLVSIFDVHWTDGDCTERACWRRCSQGFPPNQISVIRQPDSVFAMYLRATKAELKMREYKSHCS